VDIDKCNVTRRATSEKVFMLQLRPATYKKESFSSLRRMQYQTEKKYTQQATGNAAETPLACCFIVKCFYIKKIYS
jgi:hypothetical protein